MKNRDSELINKLNERKTPNVSLKEYVSENKNCKNIPINFKKTTQNLVDNDKASLKNVNNDNELINKLNQKINKNIFLDEYNFLPVTEVAKKNNIGKYLTAEETIKAINEGLFKFFERKEKEEKIKKDAEALLILERFEKLLPEITNFLTNANIKEEPSKILDELFNRYLSLITYAYNIYKRNHV
jgi:hypothetical protein